MSNKNSPIHGATHTNNELVAFVFVTFVLVFWGWTVDLIRRIIVVHVVSSARLPRPS